MKLLVCVKQVAEFAEMSATGADASAPHDSDTHMNPFDLYAVEECLRLKDTIPECAVDVVSVGDDRVIEALRKALGMGADRGIHLRTPGEEEPDPFSVASRIAAYVRQVPYDLIVTGMMAEDGMYAQVGPMTAEMLSRPCAIAATLIEPLLEKERLYVEKEMDGGMRTAEELELPAVVAVQIGANKPRYPSLSNILRAKKQQMETLESESMARQEPREAIVRLRPPGKTRSGSILEGSGEEKAAELLKLLHGRAFL